MKHTPEPWKVHHHSHINREQWLSILNGTFDITHNGAANPAVVACSKYSAMTDEENLANAQRIVDCVNACEGINPKAVPDLLGAAKYALADLEGIAPAQYYNYNKTTGKTIIELRQAIAKTEENGRS